MTPTLPAWRFGCFRPGFSSTNRRRQRTTQLPASAVSGLEKRRRIVRFDELTVSNAGKLSYKGDAKKRT